MELGHVVITSGVAEKVTSDEEYYEHMMECLSRYYFDDWGDLDAHDKRENEIAKHQGRRTLGEYKSERFGRLWLITEAGITTIMLPEEY